jgi:O-antigen/teichoic acid export membrane protein
MHDYLLKKAKNFSLLIGEGALDLGVNLIVMILVERSLGEAGLGIFAYLLSLLLLAGFLSEVGISRYLERKIALTKRKEERTKAIEKAFQAVFVTSIFCGVLFLLSAVSGAASTRVEERAAAYFIIGFLIPLRNFNRLKIAVLQGDGKHDIAATLKIWKRIFLLGAVFLLLAWGVAPSYLMFGYFISEFGFMIQSGKAIKLPGIKTIWNRQHSIRSTLHQSYRFLLTDEALEVILHMDFLVLGLFVSSWNLGVYAEASILARIFLLVPISIKPVFRKKYCSLVSQNRLDSVAGSVQTATAALFFLQSVLALYILLYFSDIMRSLYHTQGTSLVPFYIFSEILPGLLFFSTVVSQEPVYEAEGKVALLQKTVIIIAFLNLMLNFFFIPFAGFFGAAFATAGSMFVYFILFGRHLNPILAINKRKHLVAGMAVYLTFMLFKKLDFGFMIAFFLVPAFLFMLFVGIDFFSYKSEPDSI